MKTDSNEMQSVKTTISQGVVLHKDLSVLEYDFNLSGVNNPVDCVLAACKMLEYIETYKVENLLINSIGNKQIFNKSMEGWLNNVVYHHLYKANIKNIAMVADEAVLRLRKNKFASESGIRQVFFDSYSVALLWLTAKNKIKNI